MEVRIGMKNGEGIQEGFLFCILFDHLNSFKLIITIGNDNSEWDSFLCLRSSYLVVAVVHLVIISSFTYQLLIEFLLCAWPYSFRAQEKTSRITDILVTCLWWPSLKGKETALRI